MPILLTSSHVQAMLEEQEKHKQAETAETAYVFCIACCGNERRCTNKGQLVGFPTTI